MDLATETMKASVESKTGENATLEASKSIGRFQTSESRRDEAQEEEKINMKKHESLLIG